MRGFCYLSYKRFEDSIVEQKNNKCQYEWRDKIGTYEHIHECNESALKDSKEGYCIFHERSEDKDIAEFQAKVDKKIQNQDYDFTGFYFPKEVNFSFQIFTKDVCFWNAVFKEETDLGEVRFEKGADFRGAEFKEEADSIITNQGIGHSDYLPFIRGIGSKLLDSPSCWC